ncbi:MAG: hypothetical protein WDM85_14355 [Caulobacteraceae bacterium]
MRAQSLSDFKRCYYPVGFQRQYAGVVASPDRRPKPEDDHRAHRGDPRRRQTRWCRSPGGVDTAENIAAPELIVVPGVGHEMPAPVLDVFVNGILSALARAKVSV